jgi:hypothetical protein
MPQTSTNPSQRPHKGRAEPGLPEGGVQIAEPVDGDLWRRRRRSFLERVCVCVCIYIYNILHVYVYKYIYIYLFIYIIIYIYIHYVCVYIYTHIDANMCTYQREAAGEAEWVEYIYIHKYIYLHVCIYTHIDANMCTYQREAAGEAEDDDLPVHGTRDLLLLHHLQDTQHHRQKNKTENHTEQKTQTRPQCHKVRPPPQVFTVFYRHHHKSVTTPLLHLTELA